jgi:hypothetical protein
MYPIRTMYPIGTMARVLKVSASGIS